MELADRLIGSLVYNMRVVALDYPDNSGYPDTQRRASSKGVRLIEVGLYAQDIDIPRLIMQLQMLPDLLKTYNEKNPSVRICKVTNLRTICEIMNGVSSGKSIFREVFKLLKIALTIPVTTATAERTFSTLRRLKTFLRSTMSQPRLNHVIYCMLTKRGLTR